MKEHFEPKGYKFYSQNLKKFLLLVEDKSDGFNGWICCKHPDGQWVSLRKATPEDLKSINHLREMERLCESVFAVKIINTPTDTDRLNWLRGKDLNYVSSVIGEVNDGITLREAIDSEIRKELNSATPEQHARAARRPIRRV